MLYLNILFFTISFGLLYFGADFLVKGSVSIAEKFKVPKVVIGLTIVALGTSMPEFVISFVARLKGSSDMSVGNAVGSCIVNIALVLGLSALIRPIEVEKTINKRDLPVLLGITAAFCLFTLDFNLSRLEGAGLLVVFIVYMGALIYNAKKNKTSAPAEKKDAPKRKFFLSVFFAILGLALLVGGAQLLVYSGTYLALKIGISPLVISITMIALGTSLPELFTSVVAAVKGHSDISIGNIVGSNIFNISFVLGSSSLIGDIALPKRVSYFDNFVMLFLSLLLVPFLISGKRIIRTESFALLFIYVLYTANMFLKII